MSEELKPCPFCGSKNIVSYSGLEMSGVGRAYITCMACGCRTAFFYWEKSEEKSEEVAKEKATDAWQKRN